MSWIIIILLKLVSDRYDETNKDLVAAPRFMIILGLYQGVVTIQITGFSWVISSKYDEQYNDKWLSMCI